MNPRSWLMISRPRTAALLAALATLAGAFPTVGQDAGPAPEQARIEEAQADVPAAERNRVRDMGAANNGSDRLTMNFRDASLEAIVNHLSEHAGLIVVSEIDLSDKVTVLNRQPVTLDEAIGLLNTLLRERGYTAVRRGRLLEIVDIDDAKELALPVRYGADPDAIGMSDTMITQIVPLRFADAEALVENLEDLIDDDFAELSANASSNALIVTNTEANIRRIVEIARALDQSIAEVRDVRVFALQHADAEDVAQLIEEVFEAPRSVEDEVGRIIAQRFGRGGRGRDDDSSGDTAAAAAVQAAADVRSNSVVVTAPAESMEIVARTIAEIDRDTAAQQAVMIYAVRNTSAAELETLLNDLFSPGSGDDDAVQRQGGQNNNRGGQGGQGGQNNNRGGNQGGNAAGGASGFGTAESASDLVGNVVAVADEATNSLVVLTAEVNFAQVRAVLEGLDRPVPQVLVRVLVAELSRTEDLDLGAELSANFDLENTDTLDAITSFGSPTSGLSLSLLTDDYTFVLSALETMGVLDVLSRPYILTRDNHEAEIVVGQEVPFVTDSRTTDAGNTINTIEYRDIGIILTVTPQINDEGLVVLDVEQEISQLLDSTVQISEDLAAITVATRSATTRVAVPDGQTVVIGGLMQEGVTSTVSKVPLLGDIPLIGAIFQRTEETRSVTELLLFLTPEVVPTPADLMGVSQKVEAESEYIQRTVAPGALRKHLDRMRGVKPQPTQPLVPPDPTPFPRIDLQYDWFDERAVIGSVEDVPPSGAVIQSDVDRDGEAQP